jgi:NAD(P)-dependent dehydrogenase (short-subunit alcohol dehydrogenase family)
VLLQQESVLVGPFLEGTPESVEKCFAIYVLGVFYTAQLNDSPSANEVGLSDGSIVLIASATAYQASKAQYLADYCSSKGAVILWPENWV